MTRGSHSRRAAAWIIAAAMATVVSGCGPGPAPMQLRVIQAEDARAAELADFELLRSALADPDPRTRAIATRALGRLERMDVLNDLLGRLQDEDSEVRRQAAFGLGQSARPETLSEVTMPLYMALSRDPDEGVRAVAAWSLGRLPYAQQPELLGDAQRALLRATMPAATGHPPATDTGAPASAERLVGVLRGVEVLLRRHRDAIELQPALQARLRELALNPGAERGGEIRALAVAALAAAGALDPEVVGAALAAPERESRRLGAEAMARVEMSEAMVQQALADDDGGVRLAALRAVAQRGDCAAVRAALFDGSPHVRLLAIDCLATCPDTEAELLGRVRTLGGGGDWQDGAHALVALARVRREAVGDSVQTAALHAAWQVRAYAATAAATLGDLTTLRALAGDPEANVRSAAISALAEMTGHDDDDLYIAAMQIDEPQLTLMAAGALAGSTDGAALPALRAALDRLQANDQQTLRDPRVALRERIAELGGSPPAESTPPPNKAWVHSLEQLEALDGAEAVITMQRGGVVVLRLLPREAPTAAIRFADMAQAGTFAGLTFHRVVPNFVIQGGSPGGNEYAGHGAYTRDEIGMRSHRRGTVGISTRGRDTGDGQIFVNLVDNIRLDGDYTIFAEVTGGMETVDAVLEGDVIESVAIRPRR